MGSRAVRDGAGSGIEIKSGEGMNLLVSSLGGVDVSPTTSNPGALYRDRAQTGGQSSGKGIWADSEAATGDAVVVGSFPSSSSGMLWQGMLPVENVSGCATSGG